jgi:outer membrane receptor protein involved in Fe transport
MGRLVTLVPLIVVIVAGGVSPVSAQLSSLAKPATIARIAAGVSGELQGVVTDDRGHPLVGAVVSALGSSTAFAVTDRTGRFSFRSLAPGPYLLRAHLQGYVPARGRLVQVSGTAPAVSSIALARSAGSDEPPQVLAAGVGNTVGTTGTDASVTDDDHSETAWRLRHLKRSVLREARPGAITEPQDDPFRDGSLPASGRPTGTSARVASGLFADRPFSGEVNLLTSTAFNRPQDLFSIDAGTPHGVAFLSLHAPTPIGDWAMRGAVTQGDLSSWVLSGSYLRRSPSEHRYEAGFSYAMQRYEGGNALAMAAVADGKRNAGTLYAYDHWTIVPGATLSYGARYASYDYLEHDGLFSPSVSFAVVPAPGFRVRTSFSRSKQAPGADEFVPPAGLNLWLPPERTFSPLSARRGFRPERVDHIELASEHALPGDLVLGLRTFRQQVDDQIVTLFGVMLPQTGTSDLGHYFVASAGDVNAHGWGVSLSRPLGRRMRGSIDYTFTDAEWMRTSPDADMLTAAARSTVRSKSERMQDVTTSLRSVIPVTETRVFVLYRFNTGFAAREAAVAGAQVDRRFDVQVNQALPFLDFTSAKWEMLLTVRNLFREDLLDGSVYDELFVVRPPTRVVGGLTVRF